jgi:hypothetical protein
MLTGVLFYTLRQGLTTTDAFYFTVGLVEF